MNRRAFLGSLCAAGIVGSITYADEVEPWWLEVTHRRLDLTKNPRTRIKILHLSDLHLSEPTPLSFIEKAFQMGLAEDPDIICLTGDYVTTISDLLHEFSLALARLSRHAPTFASLGNHDGGKWSGRTGGYEETAVIRETLENAGISCLHNRNEWLTIRGAEFCLVGVGDAWSGEMEPEKAFQGLDQHPSQPVILLSHNPDTKDDLRTFPWNLMLSGHTHGGQVVIPLFNLAPVAPIGDRRYVSGLKPWGRRFINVNCGIGTILGIRLNCRPEVTLLDVGV